MPAPGLGYSPMLASYNQWAVTREYGPHLPRTIEDYLSGAFGPLSPIRPVSIDTPREDTGRPEPRRFQYPVGWNMPVGVPGTEGLKLSTFANLRAYADLYSVARAAIQVRIKEILGFEWDIVPTDLAELQMQEDTAAYRQFAEKRKALIEFFKKPDPNFFDWNSWLRAVLEAVMVDDALALYLHPSRQPGKGVLGNDLAALDIIDGATIRPLLNMRGETPRGPAPGYQQYLWGVPRVDLMALITEQDIEEMDGEEPVQEYRADQLLYLPFERRNWTPYGFPPMEQAVLPISIGLKRQQYKLNYFTEGSIPGMFLVAGPEFSSPAQVRQLQDTLNAMAGDIGWKWKITVLPHGSDPKPIKEPQLETGIDHELMEETLMAFNVKPQEVGLLPGGHSSGMGGSGLHQANQQSSRRTATKPLVMGLKRVWDHIIQHILKVEDAEFMWIGVDPEEDAEKKAKTDQTYFQIGAKSIDEIRDDIGLPAWGLEESTKPMVTAGNTVTPLEGMAAQGVYDPTSPNFQPMVDEQGNVMLDAQGKPLPAGVREVPPQQPGAPMTEGHRQAGPGGAAAAPVAKPGRNSTTPKLPPNQRPRQAPAGNQNTSRQPRRMAQGNANTQRPTGPKRPLSAGDQVRTPVKVPDQQKAAATISVAGLAVKANDTGRVLMLQRSYEDMKDPARGMWEFPGGHLENGEDALAGAKREWEEETGVQLPPGEVGGTWTSPDGMYQGFVYVIASEGDVVVNVDDDDRQVLNPDDPDGDESEVVAWWEPDDLPDMPALRPECKDTDWRVIKDARLNKAAHAELDKFRSYVKHGRDPAAFHPFVLRPAEIGRLASEIGSYGVSQAFKRARARVDSRDRDAREAALAPLKANVARAIGEAARRYLGADHSILHFIDAGAAALQSAYREAWLQGVERARQRRRAQAAKATPPPSTYNPYPAGEDDREAAEFASDLADRQHGYLQGFAQDLVSGLTLEAIIARADQYAASIQQTYETGRFAEERRQSDDRMRIRWIGGDCHLCAQRTDVVYTEDTLPCIPGDGSFGEFCEGGPRCNCSLEYFELQPGQIDEAVA